MTRLAAPQVRGDARLSACGLYRWVLARRWSPGSLALWIMLNPSTADALKDDPTIRRTISFSRARGHGGLLVVNLFAFRATDPRELLRVEDPVGSDCDRWIESAARASLEVVCAWGSASPLARTRAREVLGLPALTDRRVVCLGTTGSGAPRHPLRLAGSTPLVPYLGDGGPSDD